MVLCLILYLIQGLLVNPYDMKLFRHYNTSEDLVNPFSSLKIYNRTLSLTEIQQNYNAHKFRF